MHNDVGKESLYDFEKKFDSWIYRDNNKSITLSMFEF